MVPADIAPIMFVIMAFRSAMLGIAIDPDFIAPRIAPGLRVPVGIEPGLPSDPRLASGDEVRSRIRLPDTASQSEIWPIAPSVPNVRLSELKPNFDAPPKPSAIERNSRPDFTSQIFNWFSLLPGVIIDDFCCCSGSGPYDVSKRVPSGLKVR